MKSDTTSLFKHADDMVLVQPCSKSQLLSEQIYFKNAMGLEDWCKLSALQISVRKRKADF